MKPKKNGIGPALFLAAITMVIGGLSLFYFYIILGPQKPPAPEQEEEQMQVREDFSAGGYDFIAHEDQRKILYLKPDFVVNLRGLEGSIVFRVKVRLEVSSLAVASELNSDRARFYRMMDDITRTLKSWTYADLTTGNGMDLLKGQLRDRINQFIENGQVTRVIFENPSFKRLLPRIKLPPDQ